MGPIIVNCCTSLYGSLYSQSLYSIVTSDWLWHPDCPSRDHLRKLEIELRTRQNTHTAVVPPHIIALALSLAVLWVHSVCCSGQWGVGDTLSSHSHSPSPHPPIVTAICAGTTLLGRGHGWRNPLQIVSLRDWNCVGFFLCLLGAAQWCELLWWFCLHTVLSKEWYEHKRDMFQ